MKDIIIQHRVNKIEDFQTLYVDIDDCLLKTSEAIIKILQSLFESDEDEFCKWSMEKCLSEEIKWDYSNFIQGRLNEEEKLELFDSDWFWDIVEIDERFLRMINYCLDFYNVVFISKGQEKNLKKKEKMIIELRNTGKLKRDVGYYGIKNGRSKSVIDMSDGIQIDDNYKYLEDTNAKWKILYRNKYCNESEYNGVQVINGKLENLYITEFVDEIKRILGFIFDIGLDNESLGI